ncbi:tRNA epoxyqueuosine(34) reductase QueG [Thiohalophilus sp.]|uniref:tRNA epoxyqueuosine(34) reductase QueG n=1 Tax=Thiohalophilus sp. TaxID=3028392 RepID=UPI003974A90D
MSHSQNKQAAHNPDWSALAAQIKQWGAGLGFQQTAITDTDLDEYEARLQQWLSRDYQGEMQWMAGHGTKRSQPTELVPETLRIISVRLDYLPEETIDIKTLLDHPDKAYISRYALGRDYHKLMRKRLQQLADRIQQQIGPFGYRAFVDSAPVMEKALAEKAGLGWIGKHSNLLQRDAGSWFFLGELYTDLPLPVDEPSSNHCGTCQTCIDVCPTNAIVEPYVVDARRCISYLTIELKGPIPVELRKPMGNRIYGCDDCQLYCPWNRFADYSHEPDFDPRQQLNAARLVELFRWDDVSFNRNLEGSAIRRIGHERWLRNIAVALGNAATSPGVIAALQARTGHSSELVREHVLWALQQHQASTLED